jgi:hypothetical protein
MVEIIFETGNGIGQVLGAGTLTFQVKGFYQGCFQLVEFFVFDRQFF